MIARVFPRLTNATPRDEYSFFGGPGLFIPENISEVHVSVAFTWDLPAAERLVKEWSKIAPARIGGPATGQRGEDFEAGKYLADGYVITSRGCPNQCWFCSVPLREGREIRELDIKDGWNILDDNLLACSDSHIISVFNMLERYKRTHKHPIEFTGGLEAKRLKGWHVDYLQRLRPKQIFFAYDTNDDLEPLREAAKLFKEAEYGSRSILRCYVLVGYPGDSFESAEERLKTVVDIGMCPMAMLYRDKTGATTLPWRRFQRSWARPAAIYANINNQ